MAEKPYKTSNELLRGALILSAAAIIVKVLSAAYRIPYQNIAGDIGFYIYQQVYPFYGVALTLSTLGFPVVISKLIAERESSKNEFAVKDIVVTSFLVLSTMGMMMFVVLFLGADWIAGLMEDPKLSSLLKIIAFSYLLMPISSVLRGYYQGINDMLPTASSQVAEQSVRVLTILVLSILFVQQGYSQYVVGKGAVFGSITGGMAGLALLLVYVILKEEWQLFLRMDIRPANFIKISKALVFQGVAFCITGLILILFQFVDSLHLYSLLRETGMGENEAKGWKGVYDRGQPLLQLGTVAANSFALALVPVISRFLQKNDQYELLNKIKLALRVSASLGLAAAIGLAVMMSPVNQMLFTDDKGTVALAIFSLSIVFTSLIMTTAAVIQSLGYSVVPMVITIIGVFSKWVLNLMLVPRYHIVGAASATVLALMVMSVLFYAVLRIHLKKPLMEKNHIYIILKSTVYMGTVVVLYNALFHLLFTGEGRMLATIQALIGVAIGAAVFVVTSIRTGLFEEEELSHIPLVSKLERFIKTNRGKNHE
ncbi:polysaccharide biosynthesis protein [Peribacillus muralis]|uniref:putative polysaccharide biosynthesis protein n=1 Tax=Peribacillus muralis TaxID=264697 RepID=UPI00070D0103|nr:polysaccharide biosynthesis protein [Peribacillus muralis]